MPPKSLFDVPGYDKVLSRVCIMHIGKTLGSNGVLEDLLRALIGTAEEKATSMARIRGDLRVKFCRLSKLPDERLAPG
jgi:hypothetical protein